MTPYTASRPTTVSLMMGEMFSSGAGAAGGLPLTALDHLGRDGDSVDALEPNGMIIWVPVPAEPLPLGDDDGGFVLGFDSGEKMSLEDGPAGAAVAAVLSARGARRCEAVLRRRKPPACPRLRMHTPAPTLRPPHTAAHERRHGGRESRPVATATGREACTHRRPWRRC